MPHAEASQPGCDQPWPGDRNELVQFRRPVVIFDLTAPLAPGMSGHPGDPPVTLVRARSHEADGYEVTQICLGSHSGTHVDAPRHFFAQGASLDCFPLERLVGSGVVLDCRLAMGGGTASHIAEQLRLKPVPAAGMALLWTEGGILTVEAAQLLLAAGVGLVGTDSSWDMTCSSPRTCADSDTSGLALSAVPSCLWP